MFYTAAELFFIYLFIYLTKSTLSSAPLLSPVTSKKCSTCSGGVALKKDPQERENWMRLTRANRNPPPKCLIKGTWMFLDQVQKKSV